jgi:ABC-2 type transport system ATP-binding protein
MSILKVSNLTKKFGDFTAVDNISFELKEGEILGLLGPNGAGKTTTMQMLLGLTAVNSGSIEYFGKDFAANRSEILEHVNFSSSYTELPWLMTVRENLNFIAYLYDIKDRKARLAKIRNIFQLEELWNKQIRELSEGQKTRVNLAKAFINFPKVLLLDEPTASLDPEVAAYIRSFLEKQRQEFSVSILITSHNMAEVEELCDRVIFINRGKIIADDTPDNLARTIHTSHLRLLIPQDHHNSFDAFAKSNELSVRGEGNYTVIDITAKQIPEFLRQLSIAGIRYDEISIEQPTLEDYFLETAKKNRL